MRTILTALATALMFFSGTLCEGVAFPLDTESLSQPAEESEFDSRIKYPSSERVGKDARSLETVKRTGTRTFEALRAKRRSAAAKRREMDYCASQMGRIPYVGGNDTENVKNKVAGDGAAPADRDAVIIDHDVRVGRIRAARTGSAPDSVTARSEYKITAEVDNRGDRGTVLIIVSGTAPDGREIVSLQLKDVLDGKESKTMAATASLSSLKSREIETWQVFRAYKFIGLV
jgi:hypothetical protein